MLHVARHTSHVTRHTSHVTRHTSHVTRHTSHVTRHTSHVTRHTSLQVSPHVSAPFARVAKNRGVNEDAYMQVMTLTVCVRASDDDV